MKPAARLLCVIVALAVLCPAQSAQTAQAGSGKPYWQQIQTPPLPPFHPQQPKRIQLKNGMVIFLQEDHELPLIDGTMRIRGGARDTAIAKTGIMSVYGHAWRTGGTKTKTGDELDDFLEARAAKVEASGGVDSTSIGFSCLKGDFNDVFAVFLDLLQNPEFRQDKIDLSKRQLYTSISRRNDDIGAISQRESAKLAWGAENPYVRQPEYSTVAAITRDDLLQFHKKYLQPNNVILGINGDFDSKVMEAALRKAFDQWQRGTVYKPSAVEFKGAKPGLYFIPKEDVNQSDIRMVYPVDITRRSPDYFPIEVMNEVLGGGFASRLMVNVRSKQGLGYSVGGGIGLYFDHPGRFTLALGTKSQSTIEGVQSLKHEMVGMIEQPADQAELQRAKDDILNSFVFAYDSKDKVLRERMAYEFYGYPPDFLEQYRAGIEKVTAGDVARVSKQYLHPDQLAVLVVGNPKDFDKPLASLGPVTPIDITIPPPPGAEKAAAADGQSGGETKDYSENEAAPTASNAEGKALIAKVVDGLGGAANVAKVKAMHTAAVMVSGQGDQTSQIGFDSLSAPPDRARITMHSPMGEIVMVVAPGAAFTVTGDAAQDMLPQRRENVQNATKRDLVNVAQHAGDPKYIFAAGGTEKVGSVDAKVLDINADGAHTRWYVDPQSGRVLRSVFEREADSGPVQTMIDYSDWRPVSGINVPFKRTITENGTGHAVMDVKEFVVNPPLDPKLFEKPGPSAKE